MTMCSKHTFSENNWMVKSTELGCCRQSICTIPSYRTVVLSVRAYPPVVVGFFSEQRSKSLFSVSIHLSSFATADQPVCLVPNQLTGRSVCDLKKTTGRLILKEKVKLHRSRGPNIPPNDVSGGFEALWFFMSLHRLLAIK